jgi:hypothetical protein
LKILTFAWVLLGFLIPFQHPWRQFTELILAGSPNSCWSHQLSKLSQCLNDAVTLVLAKMGGDWKIVHTHQTPIGGN